MYFIIEKPNKKIIKKGFAPGGPPGFASGVPTGFAPGGPPGFAPGGPPGFYPGGPPGFAPFSVQLLGCSQDCPIFLLLYTVHRERPYPQVLSKPEHIFLDF